MRDIAAACPLGDFVCFGGEVVGSVANDALVNFATSVAEAFGKIMASVGTFWLYIPTPNLVSGQGSNSDVVGFLQNSLVFYVAIAAIISIVITSIRLIITQRGENLAKIVRGIFTLIIVTAMGVPLLSLLIIAGDEFSVWIVNLPTGGADFGTNLVAAMLEIMLLSGGAVLVIVLGLVAICISLLQVGIMLVRMAMLVLLAGMLPLAGSFASTDAGAEWLKKYGGWLIAFLLYKPIAAIIYATAFALIGNGLFNVDTTAQGTSVTLDAGGQGLLNLVAGLMLMAIAVVALGALMKFVVPAVGALSGGGGGSALAAGVGAAASGAIGMMGSKGLGGGPSQGNSPEASPTGKDAAPSGSSTAGSGATGGGSASAGAGAGATAGAGAGGTAGAGAGATAGAGAGAAAGPGGMAAGAVLGAAASAASGAASGVKNATEAAVEGGPRGSN